jgi:tripartite-type tricarboxylate transporter receptor subunit TctC
LTPGQINDVRQEKADMKYFHRRQFLQLSVGTAAAPALSRLARAQTYPSRPVRIIVGLAPGGTQDVLGRLMGQWLSERLGQQFVVENRTGGAGNIAAEAVVRAPADGYTLLIVGPSNAANATLFDKLSFNFIRDIAPVASLTRVPNVLEVHPSVPVRTVPELIAYARANPGKLNFASGGNGSSQHLSAELFKIMTGTNMLHVPYRGGAAAMGDLLSGQVQVMFDNMTSSIEHIRAGGLRSLAVTTTTRSEVLPDIPTVGDFVPGYEASAVNGIGAPKATPPEIVDKLNKELNSGLTDTKLRAKLASFGASVLMGSPADYANLIVEETDKWGKVIRAANIKPD